MTWYRVGPAGIPGSLKTDMDAVLNKKFGTSTTYPPNTWPDNVNLLGPLPEKTASGAIANITDGADRVPIKNWLVTLPASLDGYTDVNAVKTGKNVIQNLKYQATSNRVNIGQSDDGFSVSLRAGTYTLSVTSSINVRAYYRGSLDGSNTLIAPTYSTSFSGTFTLSEDKDVRMWVIGQDDSVSTSDILTIQLEVGSTATAYEAYEAPTQYTAQLGRTIYGGTADIVTGEGQSTCKMVKLNSFNWSYNDTSYAYGFFDIGSNVADMTDNKNFQATNYVNNGNPRSALADGEIGVYNTAGSIRRIVIRDDSCTTLEQFLAKIADYDFVYETTDTPTDFSFTPITPTPDTELGVNNFWADEGDSDVTYRADIQLALNA